MKILTLFLVDRVFSMPLYWLVSVILGINSFGNLSHAQEFGGATWLYTDYNGFWSSGTTNFNTTPRPENSHHLLGFTWNGNTYSTGVNDDVLVENGVDFSPQIYQAFPVRNIHAKSSGTYIGLGQLYDGVDNGRSNPAPFPTPPNLASFLTMGEQGLDFGTGVANIAAGNLIFDFNSIIDPTQIGDGIPDVLVTQFADPSSTLDEIFMADADGNVIGHKISINHTTEPRLGRWVADFYEIDGRLAGVFTKTTRDLRLWGADLSAFGIDQNNYHLVRSMRYRLNGTSDPAFAAFKVGVFDIVAANNDHASTSQESTVELDVLKNDLPNEILDLSTLKILSAPSNGSASIEPLTGKITYFPNIDFFGYDQFVYEICGSSELQCDEAIVTIEVIKISLPVDFLSFTAKQSQNGNVHLNWSTAMEKDNDFFEIQYSLDAIEWTSAGRVLGQGYSNEINRYDMMINGLPEGNYFFRIQQVDFDGSIQFSDVISLRKKSYLRNLKFFPNPASTTLTLEGEPEELKSIIITNSLGQNMASAVEINKISEQRLSIGVNRLSSGIYMIKTHNSSYRFSKK